MDARPMAVVLEANDLNELLGNIGRGFPHPGWRRMLGLCADAHEQCRRIVKPTVEAKRCAWCHVAEAELAAGSSLRKCAGCELVWYCGAECQARDWRAGHKRNCTSRG